MAESIVAGNQFDLAVGIQAARGTASIIPSVRFPITGGGLDGAKVVVPIDETNRTRVRGTTYVSELNVDGTPEAAARVKMLGMLLYGVMGAKAVSGAGDPYTHTFTLASTTPYLTFWKNLGPTSGGDYERFQDCKIAGLVIRSASGGFLTLAPTVIGLATANQALVEGTVTLEDDAGVLKLSDGAGALLIDGTAVDSIEDFTFTIGQGAQRLRGVKAAGYAVSEGRMELMLETTQLYDPAFIDRFKYGTTSPADDEAMDADTYELTSGIDWTFTLPGSPVHSLQLTATRVQVAIAPLDPNVNGDALRMRCTYTILQPSGGGTALTAKVKNGLTSYAAS